MLQYLKDSLDMFRRVYKYTKTDTILISGTRPGLIAAIDKLKSKAIDPIDAANASFSVLLTGYAANKQAKRNTVDSLLFGITSGTYSYATSINNLTLQGQMKYTLTKIQKITDETIVDTENSIVSIVNPLLGPPLAGFGVDTAAVLALTTASTAFAAVESEPEEMIEQRHAYAQTIADKIEVGRQILLHEADPAANTLMASQKEWWNGYHNERVKITTGHNYNLIEGHIYSAADIGSPTPTGLYGCSIVATHESGKVYTTKSDVDGHYKLQGVLQGTFSSIKYILNGFHELDQAAFKLVRGHVVEKDVYLQPN
jgi:hypothetical protein